MRQIIAQDWNQEAYLFMQIMIRHMNCDEFQISNVNYISIIAKPIAIFHTVYSEESGEHD